MMAVCTTSAAHATLRVDSIVPSSAGLTFVILLPWPHTAYILIMYLG